MAVNLSGKKHGAIALGRIRSIAVPSPVRRLGERPIDGSRSTSWLCLLTTFGSLEFDLTVLIYRVDLLCRFTIPLKLVPRMEPMIEVARILDLHSSTVERWHRESVDAPFDGVWGIICTQHGFNFQLWHEEDIARSPDVSDGRIAQVKRAIDRFNQQRNDWIERVDDWITQELERRNIVADSGAKMSTETPGMAIDRLSILSLRLYHLQEQLERVDVSDEHRQSVGHKIAVCRLQKADLSRALEELLGDIEAGVKRHRTYRQFKMYNDPALNPYLYDRRKAG